MGHEPAPDRTLALSPKEETPAIDYIRAEQPIQLRGENPPAQRRTFDHVECADTPSRSFEVRMQWQVLLGMGESAATISRAVERGWVILQDVRGKPLERKAALTDEGRRLSRKGR